MTQYISCLPSEDLARLWPRSLSILGSTGSIGTSALSVVDSCPGTFTVAALAAARNVTLLAEQAKKYRPRWLAVLDEAAAADLARLLPAGYSPHILTGSEGYATLAALDEADVVLSAQVGAAGLAATEAAARAGKIIALANKESLVLAGDLIRSLCAASGAVVLPVDSEHNAIFQCLHGRDMASVRRLILTASGGPFRGKNREFLQGVTPQQALAHPNWAMGPKISIDSATMMNKGLEVIEAHYLYGLPLEQIDVLVHPQSLVHSLVEYTDGSMLAQCGPPDMRLPIAHCLGWPKTLDPGAQRLDLTRAPALTFEEPDLLLFPCLLLAQNALAGGKGLPVVLNAANEVAVARFLAGHIGFVDIPALVADALEAHDAQPGAKAPATLNDILLLDQETRRRMAA